MYRSIFELLQNALYGGLELTGYMELTLTIVSTLAVLFCLSVPFIICYRLIKLLGGGL